MVRSKPSWWLEWPKRHEQELAAFARHGAAVAVDHEANGVLIWNVDWPSARQENLELTVAFSFLHPFFPPSVLAPHLSLTRHQNPVTGGLCLVAQGHDQWDANGMVADMIARQLEELFGVLEDRERGDFAAAAQKEEVWPDPVSLYFNGLSEAFSAAYFAQDIVVPHQATGRAAARLADRPFQTEAKVAAVEIELRRIEPWTGAWMTPSFEVPTTSARTWRTLPARWVRASLAGCRSADDLMSAAERAAAAAEIANAKNATAWNAIEKNDVFLTTIVSDDEADYEGRTHRPGLTFLLSRRKGRRVVHEVIRSFGIGEHLFDRLPLRAALRPKKALLIGCGAIGSFVALELARAGFAHVTLIDHDLVEPGNYVRWPIGREAWGMPKALILAGMITAQYPYTAAEPLIFRVGVAESDAGEVRQRPSHPHHVLRRAIDEADVIIDATADSACQQALAYLARRAGKPLVIGNGTFGAFGGIVAQFRPDSPACFNCLRQQWVARGLPTPPEDPAGKLVPVGCNQETFRGGSFDLQEVSLQIVRSAIGMVVPHEFDSGTWDLAVLAHFKDGTRVLPRWETSSIVPALSCCTVANAA